MTSGLKEIYQLSHSVKTDLTETSRTQLTLWMSAQDQQLVSFNTSSM